MTNIFLTSIILTLGAFAFSFTGFGFALVSLPLLAFLLPLKTAVGFVFPYVLTLVLYHTWRFGRKLELGVLWPLILGAVPAMPLGLWSLHQFPESWLKKCLAVFVVLSLLATRMQTARPQRLGAGVSRYAGFLFGLIGGWFQGAYTTGGPPAVVYVSAVSSDPEQAKGYLGAYFAVINLFTLVLYSFGGVFSVEWLGNSLAYSPAVLLGTVAGAVFSGRVEVRTYRLGVDLLLILTAVLLWFRS